MLSENLKRIRADKNITQDELANLLGVKRQTYAAYERGVSTPSASTLKILADYFNVSTDTLLSNDLRCQTSQHILLYGGGRNAIDKSSV